MNTRRFRPDPAARRALRERHGAGDDFIVLVVAYLIEEKGVDLAIRAMRELAGPAQLWIVGHGPALPALQRLCADLSPRPRVQFLGGQQHVEAYMQAADCLVCPSRWAEAAGLVNLEAQACGLPVVASDIGGIPELVADGKTGLLFPPGDVPALAATLRRLQTDADTARRLGSAGRERCLAEFSPQCGVPAWVNDYCNIMDHR